MKDRELLSLIRRTHRKSILIIATLLTTAVTNAEPNLVGWWKMDDGIGNFALDSSGANRHGILGGNPQWTTGIRDGGLSFDGSGDYVKIEDDDVFTPAHEITIMFWLFNYGGHAGVYKFASCPSESASPGNSRAYYLVVNNDNKKISATIFSSASTYDTATSVGTVEPLEWRHVAMTFDNGEVTFYINKAFDSSHSLSVSSIMNDVQPLYIGGYWEYCGTDSWVSRLNGIIDDVRIYDRALTETEISEIADLNAPFINVSPIAFELSAFENGPNPPDEFLYIRNVGPNSLNWQITSDCNWISAEPNSGISTGDTNQVTLTFNTAGLGWGLYDCNLIVSDSNAINTPQIVPVEMRLFMEDGLDFGDAPEDGTNYSTTVSKAGARHLIDPGIFLGSLIDEEIDGQPGISADGDDTDYFADEDGVKFNTALVLGKEVEVEVVASTAGFLNAWLDFNIDGDWWDPCEQIFTAEPLSAGTNTLTFDVPEDANEGDTYARFRFSTYENIASLGLVNDGEVEDYAVTIEPICTCLGDATTSSTGIPGPGEPFDPDLLDGGNGIVSIADLVALVNAVKEEYNFTREPYEEVLTCFDVTATRTGVSGPGQPFDPNLLDGPDGKLSMADVIAIVNAVKNEPGFSRPCIVIP